MSDEVEKIDVLHEIDEAIKSLYMFNLKTEGMEKVKLWAIEVLDLNQKCLDSLGASTNGADELMREWGYSDET